MNPYNHFITNEYEFSFLYLYAYEYMIKFAADKKVYNYGLKTYVNGME